MLPEQAKYLVLPEDKVKAEQLFDEIKKLEGELKRKKEELLNLVKPVK